MSSATVILLGAACVWAILSGLLLIGLRRDYAGSQVTIVTAILLWPWHTLNYGILILLALDGVIPIDLPSPLRVIGGLVAVAGLALIAAGFLEFRSVRRLSGTVVDRLIDTGVYRFSRHPQYAGIIGTLFGGALAAGTSFAALLFAAILSLVFVAYLPTEERFVAQQLGEQYEDYRQRTPMLLGRPR